MRANVGKTPAVLGLDFMDYTESRMSLGAQSTDVEKAIEFSQQGGIVTFVWHWGAPAGLYNTAEQPWWSGFYTAATDFDITAALADTVNANYTLLMKDIDTIAVQLRKLQDAGVPVLFRPLHEAEGGWFWVCCLYCHKECTLLTWDTYSGVPKGLSRPRCYGRFSTRG